MFNSTVLDVAIGVIMSFLAISLITSAMVEALSSVLKLRSKTLLRGVQELVNDPNLNGLAGALYAHAAINPRGAPIGNPQPAPGWLSNVLGLDAWQAGDSRLRHKPAYIDRVQFATALLDVTGLSTAAAGATPSAGEALAAAMRNVGAAASASNPQALANNPQLAQLLQGMVERTQGDIGGMKLEIASWFDTAMDQVGGAYKRWSQAVSFVVALAIAIIFNVSTIQLAHQLWLAPTVAAQLKPPAGLAPAAANAPPDADRSAAAAQIAVNVLNQSLPVGWPHGFWYVCEAPGPNAPKANAKAGSNNNECAGTPKVPPPSAGNGAAAGAAGGPVNLPGSPPGTRNDAPGLQRVTVWQSKDLVTMLLGWLITAFATLFGAPFWFDVLQGAVRLKGTGPSPKEKVNGTAASA